MPDNPMHMHLAVRCWLCPRMFETRGQYLVHLADAHKGPCPRCRAVHSGKCPERT